MLSDKIFKNIANEFIGDSEESIFKYKSGNELVQFFNDNYDTEFEYGPGFPSRWMFVSDTLKKMNQEEKLSEFFATILSKEYLCHFEDISPVNIGEIIEEIRQRLNLLLYTSPLEIKIHNEKVSLLNKNMELEYIDSGSFADVYKIKGRNKAKKKLKDKEQAHKDSRHRFKREYEITESLKDLNHVIDVNNYNPSDGSYELEWAESNLYDFLRQEDSIDKKGKLNIVSHIVETMAQVHDRDIIHRDLTPQNVLCVGGVVKISDFGVGKELNQGYSYNTYMTKNVGQLQYSAPEQLRRLKDADKTADVFSLGRLINFILTLDPLNFDHDLKMICRKATANNYKNRYSDAGELLNAIEGLHKSRNDLLRKDRIMSNINKINIDDEVTDYIVSLTTIELDGFIADQIYSDRAIIKIIEKNPDFAEDMIIKLHDIVYKNTELPFHIYDKYAAVAQFVLSNESLEISYDEQILAAEIMDYVATSINRFDVQREVKSVLQLPHLDENIKDIFK